ncbi:hypothetical protein HY384_03635 [Candidatus Daviesbacteria bacterium]|nr:hypothetical protein [Candidatus Daviesbacteria bacterium]
MAESKELVSVHKHELKKPWSGTEHVWEYYMGRNRGLPFRVTRGLINTLEEGARIPGPYNNVLLIPFNGDDSDNPGQDPKCLTVSQLAETLTHILKGAGKIAAEITGDLERDLGAGRYISLVQGFINGPFVAVVDWGTQPPSDHQSPENIRFGRG